MILFLIRLLNFALNLFALLLLVQIFVTYFLEPYHPVRRTLDRIFEPMLTPIRRRMPRTGMFDFSPMVLLLFVWLITQLLIYMLRAWL